MPSDGEDVPVEHVLLAPGESLISVPKAGFHSEHTRAHIAAAHGIHHDTIPSGRCAVVDANGVVVNAIVADPDLDSVEGHTLIPSDTLDIGHRI